MNFEIKQPDALHLVPFDIDSFLVMKWSYSNDGTFLAKHVNLIF